MVKKSVIFFLCIILLSTFVIAQDYKLEISTAKETFTDGENITLKVTLYDINNNILNKEILVVLEDAEKNIYVEQTIPSNEFIDIALEESASYGQGTITASYQDSQTTGSFVIGINELVKFEIEEENLIVTNIGNTKYTKTIHILIGETSGTQHPKIDVGKSVSYKLVAPEGVYNIKVYDDKTTLTRGEIKLTGTGDVIGAIDKSTSSRSGMTGGLSPDEDNDEALLNYLKKGKFSYVFILVVFGATILLAIERRYKARAK